MNLRVFMTSGKCRHITGSSFEFRSLLLCLSEHDDVIKALNLGKQKNNTEMVKFKDFTLSHFTYGDFS